MTEDIKELEKKLKSLKKEKSDRIKLDKLKSDIKKMENEKKPITKLKKIGKNIWDSI